MVDYLVEHGYDASLVDHYWPEESGTPAAAEDEVDPATAHEVDRMERPGIGSDLSPRKYINTVLTVLSSPIGFLRRTSLNLWDAGIFTLLNTVSFLLLNILSRSGIAALRNQPFLNSVLSSFLRTGEYLIAITILSFYIATGAALLGRRTSFVKSFAGSLYSSVVLLLAWMPYIGPLVSLASFYIFGSVLKEEANMTRYRRLLILFIGLAAAVGWIFFRLF
jgi:hypothetical protein